MGVASKKTTTSNGKGGEEHAAEFIRTYERHATFAKQLEKRWFHPPEAKPNSKLTERYNNTPFLQRTLTYNAPMDYIPKKKDFSPKEDNTNSTRDMDLLRKVFKHRVERYNEDLLGSPRRATRASYQHYITSSSPAISSPGSKTGQAVIEVERVWSVKMDDSASSGKRALSSPDLDAESKTKKLKTSQASVKDSVASLPPKPAPQNKPDDQEPQNSSKESSKYSTSTVAAASVAAEEDSKPSALPTIVNGGICFPEPTTKMFFHYLFMTKERAPGIHVEAHGKSRRCPFCFLDAFTDSGLLMHCRTTHGDSFTFEGATSKDKSFHVAVLVENHKLEEPTSDHLVDYTFVRTARATILPEVKTAKGAPMDNGKRRKSENRILKLPPDHPNQRENMPTRQYYHSRTNLPITDDQWDLPDSEEESDCEWQHVLSEDLIDEFEDVADEEKAFMKLWNYFMKKNTMTSDQVLPSLCFLFIKAYKKELKERNLRPNLLMHMMNLWDFGLVSSQCILDCMMKFDESDDERDETKGKLESDTSDREQDYRKGQPKSDSDYEEESPAKGRLKSDTKYD